MSTQRRGETAAVEWQTRPLPAFDPTTGQHVAIAPFDAERDAADLVDSLCGPENADLWTYIPVGPFGSADEAAGFFAHVTQQGWIPYVFRRPEDGKLIGTASHMRIRPEAGSAEVGSVIFSPLMKRTAAATEAMYRMAYQVLETTGYRRYEWKCDHANEASKRAARRFGFQFEGIFRQDMIVRDRNRDTAWFSMLDSEWPTVKRAFETWLDAENFAEGAQKRSLGEIRESLG